MMRKISKKKLEGVKLSQKALDSLRKDNKEPGFDYPAALLKLRDTYSYEQIAEFCRYGGKSSIAKVIKGTIPSHPVGELIYILYVETFKKKKPASKSFQE